MAIWSAEIKELEKLYESFKGQFPELAKELERLIKADDENMILLYSRRCLEVIITDLCECELERPRKTEPLKGIIDKLHKEEKVPDNIITSMDHLNSLSAYGAHPKEFDHEQVKPVLVNLDIIIKWYLKYKDLQIEVKSDQVEAKFATRQQTVSPPEKSIIVLPFENISPDPDQEYFSDGLTEEIITDLSHIHDLIVISRNSAMTFKGTNKKTKEIASEINVRYVLEGSVRKAGNSLRINAQLIDGINDSHIWAEKYSGTLDDIFDIQEKVSRSIVDTLKLKLSPQENQSLSNRPIENIPAYELFLKANAEIMKFTEPAINKAILFLQYAIDIIGDNALLYSGLAFAYFNLVNIGVKHEEYLLKAEGHVKMALELDPDFPKANVVLGWIYCLGKPIKSVFYLKKALTASPDDSDALAVLAVDYMALGRINDAEEISERLIQINPLDFPPNYVQGALHFYRGHYKDALEAWSRLYKMYPESAYSQFSYALILAYNNRNEEAFSIIDESAKTDPDSFLTKLGLILKYSLAGDKEKIIIEMTQDFRKTVEHDYSYSHYLAGFLSMVNLKDKALYWLENSVNMGMINYPLLNNLDPFLKNIRGEERFKKLMERVKYEWENFEV